MSPEEIQKHAQEVKLWITMEQDFIDRTGRALTDAEAKDLMWQAEQKIWGPAGCGRCKPGWGCRRNEA